MYLNLCSIASSVIQMIWSKYNPQKVKFNNSNQEEEDDDSEIDDGSTADTMIDSCVPRMWEANIVMDSYLDCGMYLLCQFFISHYLILISLYILK